ncbi:nucleoside diphosphate kinase regulator [Isosphaeraceae bacterium EP7]
MRPKTIYITEFDRDRLVEILDGPEGRAYLTDLDGLRSELGRAKIVPPEKIPRDVITMNSKVRLVEVESAEEEEFTLVFPREADAEMGLISVIAPLGTAMLGYRVGDVFEWDVPAGRKRWRVSEILYQPESSGDFHL